jgi:hypothetical protein
MVDAHSNMVRDRVLSGNHRIDFRAWIHNWANGSRDLPSVSSDVTFVWSDKSDSGTHCWPSECNNAHPLETLKIHVSKSQEKLVGISRRTMKEKVSMSKKEMVIPKDDSIYGGGFRLRFYPVFHFVHRIP